MLVLDSLFARSGTWPVNVLVHRIVHAHVDAVQHPIDMCETSKVYPTLGSNLSHRGKRNLIRH